MNEQNASITTEMVSSDDIAIRVQNLSKCCPSAAA